MDPKLSQLDPALKQAYDRVMNGQQNQPTQGQQIVSPPSQAPNNASATIHAPSMPEPTPQAATQPQQINQDGMLGVSDPQSINSPIQQPPAPPVQGPDLNQGFAQQAQAQPEQPVQQPQAPQQTEPMQPQTSQTGGQPTPPQAQNIGGSIAFNAAGPTQTVVKKGSRNFTHVLLALGAVVFLIAYTFLWVFIFKIKIPFLPA